MKCNVFSAGIQSKGSYYFYYYFTGVRFASSFCQLKSPLEQ